MNKDRGIIYIIYYVQYADVDGLYRCMVGVKGKDGSGAGPW